MQWTKICRLYIDVHYDEDAADPEGLAAAFDTLLETAMSTPGILDEYGNPAVGEFYCQEPVETGSFSEWLIAVQNLFERLHLTSSDWDDATWHSWWVDGKTPLEAAKCWLRDSIRDLDEPIPGLGSPQP